MTGIRELSRGNEQAALRSFARALADDPCLAALCTARLHLLSREPEQALRTLRSLAEREPGVAEASYLMGVAHRQAFRTFEALRSFREALRLDPSHARAAEALAELTNVDEP